MVHHVPVKAMMEIFIHLHRKMSTVSFFMESYRNYSVVNKQTVVLQHAGRYRNASPSIVWCKRLYRLALILAGEKEKTGGGLKWLLMETQGQRQSDLMGSLSVMPLLL